ncbi:biosynthetic peptidoglycan transglycosylase [Roseburia hominis]
MRKKRRKKHPVRKIFISLFFILLCLLFVSCAFYGVKGYRMYDKAVKEKSIRERVEEIHSMEGFTPYSELPQFYIDATISVEDHRFNRHPGIDLIAIGRAVWTDLREMSFVEGGSTITQQLAKNMLFTQGKKLERKAAEVFAALELESQYTKEEIFGLYANTVYFGNGCYGIRQAAVGYFGKEPSELSDYECAVLAGLPNAPSVYSLDENKELALQRVEQVLRSMVRNKIITQEEADRIVSAS